ncbi:site-specific integrase [Corynebacterium argentoratense]|nr:site-specific integrase [Corynebacterium argentoratense]
MDKAPSTIRQFHGILAGVLDVAVQDGLIPVNPARNLRLPRRSTPVKAYLTVEQLGALATQAGEHGTLVWVLGTVGLRWGEAVGLQVGDVDFERGRIRVQRNAVQLNQGFVIGAPKSGKTREVAVPLPVLRRLHKEVEGKSATCWVFEAHGGGPLRKSSTRTGWFAAAVAACRRADSSFPRLTPHGLRHVAAGLMVSAGANVKVVQRQLGHASAAMTLDTYADLFDGDLDGVAVAMGESLRNVVGLSWDRSLRAV